MFTNKKLTDYHSKINDVKSEVKKVIIWQDVLIEKILITFLAGWHILLEWVPWLAKTLTLQTISKTLDLDFTRVSFTPDLLPWDLLWGEIYNQKDSTFATKKWPIFTNILLADEINRAPSKVQSALLEAMQEKKVSISDKNFKLNLPFFVLATQNPIEQEWTYPLPEAQLDRFLLKTIITYPTQEEELQIMKIMSKNYSDDIKKIFTSKDLLELQDLLENEIYVDDKIYEYVKNLAFATRFPQDYKLEKIAKYISYGVSPRASIGLIKTAKVNAFFAWRDYVNPDDIKYLIYDIFRHRIGLSFDAMWDNIDVEYIIGEILNWVIVP